MQNTQIYNVNQRVLKFKKSHYFTIDREWKTFDTRFMSPRPKKYKNPAQISLRIDLSQLQEIDRRRAKDGVTRSDFINAVLKQYMEKNPKGANNLSYPSVGPSK